MRNPLKLIPVLLCLIFSSSVFGQVEPIISFYPGSSSFVRDVFHTGTDAAYVRVLNQSTQNNELWITDGTQQNTVPIVTDMDVLSSLTFQTYAYLDGSFFFFAEGQNGQEGVYRYDESNGNVTLLEEHFRSSGPRMYQTGGHVYFLRTSESLCNEIYKATANGYEQVLFPAFYSDDLPNCTSSIENLKIIETTYGAGGQVETYFIDSDRTLIRVRDGVASHIFEQAGLLTDSGAPAVKIYGDYFTVYGRKFIFHGTVRVGSELNEGVYSIDLDNYELQTLVDYPYGTQVISLDNQGIEYELLHYLPTDNGVYFLTLDESSSTNAASNKINNTVLYFSDGTSGGTERIYAIEDLVDNPFSVVGVRAYIQALIGSDLVIKSYRADGEDLFEPELYTLNLNTGDEELLRNLTPFAGKTFDYFQGKFKTGYAFLDYPESGGNQAVLYIGDGSVSGTTSQPLTTSEESYRAYNSGLAVIDDTVFVFTGKMDGEDNHTLFKYNYKCDTGNCNAGTNEGGGTDEPGEAYKLIFEERFYSLRYDTLRPPMGWTRTKATDPDLPNTTWFVDVFGFLGPYIFPQYLDSQGLTFLFQGDSMLDEEVVSPEIPISGRSGLIASIEAIYSPASLQQNEIQVALDAAVDGVWTNLYQSAGGDEFEFQKDTLRFDLGALGEGDILQFRMRANSEKIFPGGDLSFGFDRLKVFEMDSSVTDTTFEEITVFEDLFGIPEMPVDSSDMWTVIQRGVPENVFEEVPTWTYEILPDFSDFTSIDILPGIDAGYLWFKADQDVDQINSVPAVYNEIIASPFIDLKGFDSLYVSLNALYHPFVLTNDEVTFQLLGRPDTDSEWLLLHEITPDPEQIGSLEALKLENIDFDLSNQYNADQIQVGIRVQISNYDLNPNSEGYFIDNFRIYQRKENISVGPTSNEDDQKVAGFTLHQNYPNPFNPVTVISFELKKQDMVSLTVFDVLGRQVAELVNGRLNSGSHRYTFNASTQSSGIYFYRLQTGGNVQTRKMMLIK